MLRGSLRALVALLLFIHLHANLENIIISEKHILSIICRSRRIASLLRH